MRMLQDLCMLHNMCIRGWTIITFQLHTLEWTVKPFSTMLLGNNGICNMPTQDVTSWINFCVVVRAISQDVTYKWIYMLWGEIVPASPVQYYWGRRGLMVIRLLWLSVSTCSQARGVLDSTPGSCIPFDFPLFLPYNIYFQQKAILWAFRVRKPLGMGSFLMERISQSTPNSWRLLAFHYFLFSPHNI